MLIIFDISFILCALRHAQNYGNDAMNTEIEIEEATPETISDWLAKGEAILVDVRETSEYEQEHIPGSMLVPLSALDPDVFPHISVKKLVLHCAIGKRSAAAAKQLVQAGHTPPINMAGGLKAWREAGLETEIFDAPPAAHVDQEPLETEPIKSSDISPGEVLMNEFIKPHNISEEELARDIGLPTSHILAVIEAARPIDADTAFRLARYFSTSEEFWLRLQIAFDMEQAKRRSGDEIAKTITPRKKKIPEPQVAA